MVRRNNTRSLAVILIHPDGPPPAGGVHLWRPIRKPAPSSIEPELPGSVIENELPTYRAISNLGDLQLGLRRARHFQLGPSLFLPGGGPGDRAGFSGPSSDSAVSRHVDRPWAGQCRHRPGAHLWTGLRNLHDGSNLRQNPLAEQFAKHYAETLQSASSCRRPDLAHVHPATRKDQTGEQLQKQIEIQRPPKKR